jgi:hypothetical protein
MLEDFGEVGQLDSGKGLKESLAMAGCEARVGNRFTGNDLEDGMAISQ